MAVQEPGRPNVGCSNEDSDDEKPLIFKRGSSSTSKQSQSIAEVVKTSLSVSQNSNGQSMNSHKGIVSAPVSKEILGSDQPSSSSAKVSPAKLGSSPETFVSSNQTSATSPIHDLNQHNGPLEESSMQGSFKNEHSDYKSKSELTGADEDSEDDKPLSLRVRGTLNSPSNVKRIADVPLTVKPEDSDDDNAPISSKFSGKMNQSVSCIQKASCSTDKKPVNTKIVQNGLSSKSKSPLLPAKRSIGQENHVGQSSVKKLKQSDATADAKVKKGAVKAEVKHDDEHIPISQRIKSKASADSKPSTSKKVTTKVVSSSFKKGGSKDKKQQKSSQYSKSTKVQPCSTDGQKKWTTLIHNGVIFPPTYQPHGIKVLYNGKPVDLTPDQEEVATMYAVMKDTDYMQKQTFRDNFWNDWRKILGKNHIIQRLENCDFTPIYEWCQQEKDKKKQMSSDEKKTLREEKLKQEEKYMWAIVDGVKEKVGNFRVEPPGLFRGRGEHPRMGKLKKRIRPSDITLNIGKDAPIPECPIPGERWKEVKHDNTVTWLAFWNDPINPKEFKYVFLAASSSLKGQSDKEKYEKARKLKDYIHNIRAAYTKNFNSNDKMKRQIAVATYLIDKLALRAGNEKDDDEADTVGCCTLKVANVECIPPNKLKFDFLGKDSIKYENTVEVEPPVYKAIGQFRTGKKQGDDLFDLLDTSKLNAHLKELMPGLTAKVFRTYNASITLDEQLHAETGEGDVAEKVVVYNQANKQVAIICNHQRTISKKHDEQMLKLTDKVEELKGILKELKTDLERARKGKPPLNGADGKPKRSLSPEALEKKIATTNQKIEKMEFAMHTKEDLKTVALGTSKINYLDPRITVAWCKRHDVPIEKVFNKSLLAKFAWAMDVDPEFHF